MIIDRLENIEKYGDLIPGLLEVSKYLKSIDTSSVSAGRYDLEGTNIFHYCFEYESKPVADCPGEAHKKYIDLHLILEGRETVGILDGVNDKLHGYSAESDYMKTEGSYRLHDIEKHGFCMFFQHEGHITGGYRDLSSAVAVKKFVFKIPFHLNKA